MSIVCAAPEVGTKKSRNYPCPLGRSPRLPHFTSHAPPLSALSLEQHPLPYLSLPHLFQSTAIIRSRNMQVEYRATLYSSPLLLSVSNLTFQTTPSPSPPSPPPLSHRLIIIIHHPPTHPSPYTYYPPSLPPPLTPYRPSHPLRRGPIRLYFPPLLLSFFVKRNTEKKCPRIDGIANIMDVDVILVVVSIWNDIR